MRKRTTAIALMGLLFICLFLTPVRYIRNDSSVRFKSIFSDGFLDYERLFLFMGLWLVCVFAVRFADFGFLRTAVINLFLRRLGARAVDQLVILLFFFLCVVLV